MPRTPAKMVPRQIGGDSVKPGGKFFVCPKTGFCAEDADESFLREIIGVVLIADHAAEKTEHRCCVAFHQVIERRVMAGDQSLHIVPVMGISVGDAHGRRWKTWISRFLHGNRG